MFNSSITGCNVIGNPLNDGTWTYTWAKGRQLHVQRERPARRENMNGTATSYVLHGKNVVHLTQGGNDLLSRYSSI